MDRASAPGRKGVEGEEGGGRSGGRAVSGRAGPTLTPAPPSSALPFPVGALTG